MEHAHSRNIPRTVKASAKTMLKAVKGAIKDVETLIGEEMTSSHHAWTDAGRERMYNGIRKRMGTLEGSLAQTLETLTKASAKSGNAKAIKQAGADAITAFSEEHLAEYVTRVNPDNAPSLASVYTKSMEASVVTALRQTAVSVFTRAAASGMTMNEQARAFQTEWSLRCKDADPYRFVDKSGRKWENARYIQMLTRTTAQRVETAAFCDSMLSDGFPLARISNDSGNDCSVCGEWEGRLIDLTPGHQLKGGTYTLQQAREAGLFHPNCTHRLEYVSVLEIPDSLWPKVKDKIGQKGAWKDNPSATNPDLPNAQERKTHIKQVEKAAEERAVEETDPISPQSIEDAIKTPEEVRKALEAKNVNIIGDFDALDQDLINENLTHLNGLLALYPKVAKSIEMYELTIDTHTSGRQGTAYVAPAVSSPRMTLSLLKQNYENYEDTTNEVAIWCGNGYWMPCAKEKRAVFTISHEFGHIAQNVLIWEHINASDTNKTEYEKALNLDRMKILQNKKASAVKKIKRDIAKTHKREILSIVKEINPQITKSELKEAMSEYGDDEGFEFFAEAFANFTCGEQTIIGQAMGIFLERSLK